MITFKISLLLSDNSTKKRVSAELSVCFAFKSHYQQELKMRQEGGRVVGFSSIIINCNLSVYSEFFCRILYSKQTVRNMVLIIELKGSHSMSVLHFTLIAL